MEIGRMIEGVPHVTADELNSLLKKNVKINLIDVRREDEWMGELGHIVEAKLRTLGPQLQQYLEESTSQGPTIFICRSGMRSLNATLVAQNLGWTHVYNLQGGMLLWNQLGFEVKHEES